MYALKSRAAFIRINVRNGRKPMIFLFITKSMRTQRPAPDPSESRDREEWACVRWE